MPTYSSRWKNTVRDQSMPGAFTSASRNSNWEAPVAAMTCALPRAWSARRRASAAWRAAAVAISVLVGKTLISTLVLQGRRAGADGNDVLHRGRIAGGGAVPDASAEGRDVDLARVRAVGHDAMAPLEVEPAQARPGGAAIAR